MFEIELLCKAAECMRTVDGVQVLALKILNDSEFEFQFRIGRSRLDDPFSSGMVVSYLERTAAFGAALCAGDTSFFLDDSGGKTAAYLAPVPKKITGTVFRQSLKSIHKDHRSM